MNNKKSFLTILVCALTFGMFGTSCSAILTNLPRILFIPLSVS